ncbi:DUF3784 domain-containing protein [Clostridium sp. D2Q-11]|uniref:DUF3784 domain-containing protein n=1 Tax=Anaeromonas frigoriresistens TaxID=2683708 RepID=A0A942UVH0_9FIRM|nr:DUF3784 domain-containing protein [Anaeromonas frigoriresistens]MBS4538255.1 DUF3784 domain-containing protein [Anaeromonas frigoriresistens]
MFLINIIFTLVGGVFIILGYLIWINKSLWLIAGYDERKVLDKDGLAKYEGLHLFIMGIFVIAISILGLIFNKSNIIWQTILILLMSIKMAVGYKNFQKK